MVPWLWCLEHAALYHDVISLPAVSCCKSAGPWCLTIDVMICHPFIANVQICEAFGANRYPFPEDPSRQRQMHGEVTARLRELHTTIEAGDRHKEAVLQNIAFNLDQWATQVGEGPESCSLCSARRTGT